MAYATPIQFIESLLVLKGKQTRFQGMVFY